MIRMNVELIPFSVPDRVSIKRKPQRRQEAPSLFLDPGYLLSDLDAETLEQLCVEFRKGVFEKAGLKDREEPKNKTHSTRVG